MTIQYKSENLLIFESALYRTTSTLIIGEDYLLLVDPNWLPAEVGFIEKQVEMLGKNKEKYLFFTHSDYDHIIGYGKFKHFTTVASRNFVQNEDKEDVLQQIRKFDDEYYIKRDYDIVYPKIDIVIEAVRERKTLGADEYFFYQATGHNKDGLIAYNATRRILIAGDYLSNIEFPYIYDSWKNYMGTLATFESIINKYPIQLIIPGHGDFTEDIAEMKKRIKESEAYLFDLTDAVTKDIAFDEKSLFERYEFPIIMKQFHQNNIKLVAAEKENFKQVQKRKDHE